MFAAPHPPMWFSKRNRAFFGLVSYVSAYAAIMGNLLRKSTSSSVSKGPNLDSKQLRLVLVWDKFWVRRELRFAHDSINYAYFRSKGENMVTSKGLGEPILDEEYEKRYLSRCKVDGKDAFVYTLHFLDVLFDDIVKYNDFFCVRMNKYFVLENGEGVCLRPEGVTRPTKIVMDRIEYYSHTHLCNGYVGGEMQMVYKDHFLRQA